MEDLHAHCQIVFMMPIGDGKAELLQVLLRQKNVGCRYRLFAIEQKFTKKRINRAFYKKVYIFVNCSHEKISVLEGIKIRKIVDL